jgi:hypothetical protein
VRDGGEALKDIPPNGYLEFMKQKRHLRKTSITQAEWRVGHGVDVPAVFAAGTWLITAGFGGT